MTVEFIYCNSRRHCSSIKNSLASAKNKQQKSGNCGYS
jgi:hypothetical protein